MRAGLILAPVHGPPASTFTPFTVSLCARSAAQKMGRAHHSARLETLGRGAHTCHRSHIHCKAKGKGTERAMPRPIHRCGKQDVHQCEPAPPSHSQVHHHIERHHSRLGSDIEHL